MVRKAGLALLSTVLLAHASDPATWVPARWQTIRALDLLEPTPINCLLVDWSTAADQQLPAAYACAARERRIAVVGLLHPGVDPSRAVAAAVEAGLDGLALEGDFANGPQIAQQVNRLLRARNSSIPVIPLGARDWLRSDPDWPVLGANDAVMPRLRVLSDSGAATATPTSEPWIESNTWLVRSLSAWGGGRPVWLGYRLPDHPSADDYARAIADAAVAGGHWVLAPDDALLAGLSRGQPEALAAWRRIGAALKFYEQHAAWRAFSPVAALGIIQDRAGPHTDVMDENLNLINRRRIPYRVIERRALTPAALEGLPALLATALTAPTEQERRLLAAFVKKGGLLVDGSSDPETLSKDLPDLLGKENLPVRLFHVDPVLAQVTAGPAGTPLLVQLVNYATEPAEQITVRVAGAYRRARLFRPDAPPADLPIHQAGQKIEVPVDKIAVSAALLLEK